MTDESGDANKIAENNVEVPLVQPIVNEAITPFYDELLAKHTTLEIAYASLQIKASILEQKDKYWADLFRKTDCAIAVKAFEFETLQKSHRELQVLSSFFHS